MPTEKARTQIESFISNNLTPNRLLFNTNNMASFDVLRMDKLSAKNYSTWKMVMRSQLIGKGLWDQIAEPSKAKATEGNEIKDEQAKSLIYLTLNQDQLAATGVCDTAVQLWEKIRTNHEGCDEEQKQAAYAEFLSLKYKKDEPIVSFIGRYEFALSKATTATRIIDESTKIWVLSNSLPPHMRATFDMFKIANKKGQKATDLIDVLKERHHNPSAMSEEKSMGAFAAGFKKNFRTAKYNNTRSYQVVQKTSYSQGSRFRTQL